MQICLNVDEHCTLNCMARALLQVRKAVTEQSVSERSPGKAFSNPITTGNKLELQ